MTQQWNAEALRESLLWTASSLAALGKEQDVIVLEGRRRTVGEILDEANEALEVETPPASAQDDAKDERQAFEAWAVRILGDNPTWRESGPCELAWQAWQARADAPAAGDARDEPVPEWAACESRRPWAMNSLKASAQALREKETRLRTAYTKDFMGVPSRFVADAYGEAAAVFEAKLDLIAASQQQEG